MMFPAVKVLIVAVTAERIVEKNEVEVPLVAFSCVIDVVAKLELPETVKVVKNADKAVRTDEKRFEVVAKLAVRLDVEAFVVTKLVVVALEIDALVALRFVLVLFVLDELVATKVPVVVLLVEVREAMVAVVLFRLVIVPDAEVRSEMVVVAKVVVPMKVFDPAKI